MNRNVSPVGEMPRSTAAPFRTNARLILASGSPRRRRLLEEQGLDFEIIVPALLEEPTPSETASQFVGRAASEKAEAIAGRHPDAWVLGADTVVVLDGVILGKPLGAADAQRMLMLLAARKHEVLTGFCIRRGRDAITVGRVVSTEVQFVGFSPEIGAAYVRTGEPLDKAGSYGIQGMGGSLVEKIIGSYSNVVGLPLAEVMIELLRLGVVVVR